MKKLFAFASTLVIAFGLTAAFATTALAINDPLRTIDITIVAPEPGNEPNYSDCSFSSAPDCEFDNVEVEWERLVDETAVAMEPGETFEPGGSYISRINATYPPEYYGDDTAPVVYLNSSFVHQNQVDFHPGEISVSYQWDIPEVPVNVITRINAIIAPPTVGENPSSNVAFESVPEGAMVLDRVEWGVKDEKTGRWVRMSGNDVFQEGRIYVVDIYSTYKDGFIGSLSSTEMLVNGQKADENMSAAGLDEALNAFTWPALSSEDPNPGAAQPDADEPESVEPDTDEPGADEPSATPENDTPENGGSPATGDSALPFVVLSGLMAVAGACALIARRRMQMQ